MTRLSAEAVATRRLQIWHELVDTCGAPKSMAGDFLFHFPWCAEFRFQGSLGFGGKVWFDGRRVYVTCYPEDETPETVAIMERANAEFARIVEAVSVV